MPQKEKIIIAVGVVVILALAAYWYFVLRGKISTAPAPVAPGAPPAAATPPPSLGEKIYNQSQNPIQGKVPATNNPAVNPIEGAYKNPF